MKIAQLPKNISVKYSSSDTTLKTFVIYLTDGFELHVRAISWLIGDYGKVCFYMQSPEEIAKMSMKGQEPIAVYAIRRGLVRSIAEEGAIIAVAKKRPARKTTKRTKT